MEHRRGLYRLSMRLSERGCGEWSRLCWPDLTWPGALKLVVGLTRGGGGWLWQVWGRQSTRSVDFLPVAIAVRNGASTSLRYLKRSQNVSLAFLRDLFSIAHYQDERGAAWHHLEWIQAERNTADIFTKPISGEVFRRHCHGLGLVQGDILFRFEIALKKIEWKLRAGPKEAITKVAAAAKRIGIRETDEQNLELINTILIVICKKRPAAATTAAAGAMLLGGPSESYELTSRNETGGFSSPTET